MHRFSRTITYIQPPSPRLLPRRRCIQTTNPPQCNHTHHCRRTFNQDGVLEDEKSNGYQRKIKGYIVHRASLWLFVLPPPPRGSTWIKVAVWQKRAESTFPWARHRNWCVEKGAKDEGEKEVLMGQWQLCDIRGSEWPQTSQLANSFGCRLGHRGRKWLLVIGNSSKT